METYRDMDVWLHALFISTSDGSEWSSARSSCFVPGEAASCSPCTGRVVSPGAGQDVIEMKHSLSSIGNRTVIPLSSSRLSSHCIHLAIQTLKQNTEPFITLGCCCFLPDPLQFIICMVLATYSVVR
jgi:hypothetical protein